MGKQKSFSPHTTPSRHAPPGIRASLPVHSARAMWQGMPRCQVAREQRWY